jgi:hypothetical protein
MWFKGMINIGLFFLLGVSMSSVAEAQMGMQYLTPDQFPKYDQILKDYGRGDLKTTVAVVTTVNNRERVGLKCVNNKGAQYTVSITDGKIVMVEKVKTITEKERKKFIEDAAREMTIRGMTPPR